MTRRFFSLARRNYSRNPDASKHYTPRFEAYYLAMARLGWRRD